MKKFLHSLLVLCIVVAFGAGAQNYQLKPQAIDRASLAKVSDKTPEIGGMSTNPGPPALIQSPDAPKAQAPLKDMAMGDDAEWTYIGTARPNENMVDIFNDNFGHIEDTDYPVYFRPQSETVWQFKIAGLFNTDVILVSGLYSGTTKIDQQATGLPSAYAGEEGMFSNYEIWMPEAEGLPFDGEITFDGYVLMAEMTGYQVDDSYDMKLTFDFPVNEVFGTMQPSSEMCDVLPIYGVNVEPGNYNVYRATLNTDIDIYRIEGFLGDNAYIVTYPGVNHSVYVASETNCPTGDPFGTGRLLFNNYRATAYFAGSPESTGGTMNIPLWVNVSPSAGYNFQYEGFSLLFDSPYIPRMEVLTPYCFLRIGEKESIVKVEHSESVTQAMVTLFRFFYDLEANKSNAVAISEAKAYPIDENGEIKVEMPEIDGIYSLGITGLSDSGKTFGREYYVYVSKAAPDDHQWEPMGTGLVKVDLFKYSYPDEIATWSEVQVEKATDKDDFYRIVNPLRVDGLADSYIGDTENDYYIYFGEGADYTLYHTNGYWDGERIKMFPVYCINASEGRYDLNVCSITLPGVDNYDVIFVNEKEAMATPMVKKVKYAVVSAQKGIENEFGTDAKTWMEKGNLMMTEIVPVNGRLTFDRDTTVVNLVVLASQDDEGNNKEYISSLSLSEEGWYKVGTSDFGQFSKWLCNGYTESVFDVYVNPFDRRTVLLEEPFKGLSTNLVSELYADFSKKRNVVLYTSPEPYNFIYTIDRESFSYFSYHPTKTGVFARDYSGDEQYREDYTRVGFETQTTMSYRSGSKDEDLPIRTETFNEYYPYRSGAVLVFPTSSLNLQSNVIGYQLNDVALTIYAPTSFGLSHAIVDEANGDGIFTVGDDISRVRVYSEPIGVQSRSENDMSKTVDEVLKDETLGVFINVVDGKTTQSFADTPGSYNYIVIGYQADGEVANVLTGSTVTTSSVEDLILDQNNAPVEYYNLNGIRIDNPLPGSLVIKRQGDTVKKVIIGQ